ncbi:MAG: beta-lactamase family protein [Acidobacteria bacterium]|nr:beta-lactamase family protein [Acidobacteriota bacterium]
MIQLRRLCLALLAVLIVSGIATASEPLPTKAQRATERLRAFMEKRQIPGLSVAVGQRGQLVWNTALGVSDLQSNAPLTEDSVFPIGSTSKILTSVALGQLIEAGKIDPDAPIRTYVPYFEEKAHPITVRLVAGHLSGIRDYDMKAGEYHNTRRFETTREAVDVFLKDPLLFEPGTRYAYSAYNFVLLSAAIESASGQDFLSYMQKMVFSALSLKRTGPDRRPSPVPGLVTCYTAGFRGVPSVATPLDVSNKWAAGGFVSTSVEMVRVGNALLTNQLLRPDTLAVLTTPQKLKDGKETGFGYGMGWRSGREKLPLTKREVQVLHHGGTANGAMSFFVLFPEEKLVVSINCNLLFTPFGELATEAYAIADLFLQKELEKP